MRSLTSLRRTTCRCLRVNLLLCGVHQLKPFDGLLHTPNSRCLSGPPPRTFNSPLLSIHRPRPNLLQARCTASGPTRCTVSPIRLRTNHQQQDQSGVEAVKDAEEVQSELGGKMGGLSRLEASRRLCALRNQYRSHTLLKRPRIRTN